MVIGAAVVLLLVSSSSASAETAPTTSAPSMTEGWTRVVTGGFTDPGNSHVAFSTEFRGYLYVGTMASQASKLFSGSQKLGSDIWRTADGITWEQIGTPGLGDPTNIMFDLVVFKDRLDALSVNSGGEGTEIWVSENGTEFTQLEDSGFGDPNNTHAVPIVIDDRLVLAVGNSKTGVQIWVSEDGRSFRQVSVEGLCVPGNLGMVRCSSPERPEPVMDGKLYIGVTNATTGGEIWRTSDGLSWERAAYQGLGVAHRSSLYPWLVYQGQLYVVGSHSAYQSGLDVLRSSNGTDWEQVVADGFGAGEHRNMGGDLVEFQGRLYMATANEDPRLLAPGSSAERFAPQGFQLWASDNGSDWTQVGQDGFGRETSFMGDVAVYGEKIYLQTVDYRQGSQLWESTNGQEWKLIFQEPRRSFFHFGPGMHVFKGHCLYMSHDLEKGVDIWRSDDPIMAVPSTTLTSTEGTAGATGASSATTAVAGGQTSGKGPGGAGEGKPEVTDQEPSRRLSGGILALIIALAVVAAAAIGAALYLLGGARAEKQAQQELSTTPPSSTARFCRRCGSSLTPGSQYCPRCGEKL